jgi:hypothetical protein
MKPVSIVVVGRRWFDKANGNTYHSVTAYLDGAESVHVPFAYGYDYAFEQTAWEELFPKLGLSESELRYASGAMKSCSEWCRDNGVVYASEVSDVARKSDL